MGAGGAALPRTRVGREKETVTGLVTGASMMVTPAAVATWSAGATTAGSLATTTMRRTTAASGRRGVNLCSSLISALNSN